MPDLSTDWTLEHLLHHCIDHSSPSHQIAWREFHHRYHEYLVNKVRKRCWAFNVPRLRSQFPETVKDIVAEIYAILFKSLNTFRNPEHEFQFRAWITVICNNAAKRYLQKYYKDIFTDIEPESVKEVLAGIPPEFSYEVFQDLVHFLRNETGISHRHPERDINIFLLRLWEDLSSEMIYNHPCVVDEQKRLVGNVVDHYRKILRERIL